MTDNLQTRFLTTYSLPEGNIRMPGCLHVQKYAAIFHLPVIIYQLQLLELQLELGLTKNLKKIKLKPTREPKFWGEKECFFKAFFFLNTKYLMQSIFDIFILSTIFPSSLENSQRQKLGQNGWLQLEIRESWQRYKNFPKTVRVHP